MKMDEIDITRFNVPCDKNWLGGGKESTFGPIEDSESGLRSGVYWIYCLASDKVYIGSAADFKVRWVLHVRRLREGKHHSPYLQYSWDKYGESAFVFEVLEFVEPDRDWLVDREQVYMDAFQASNSEYGFNVCQTAGSCLGVKRSEETRQKKSEAARGRKHNEATIQKLRDRVFSEETRQKMSESGSRKTFSEEHRQKMSEAQRGRKHSEETRKKIGEGNRGKIVSEETRYKLGDIHRGKKVSEETRQRLSEAGRGKTPSEETRRKLREAQRRREPVSEETKQKLREAWVRRKAMRLDGLVLQVEESVGEEFQV